MMEKQNYIYKWGNFAADAAEIDDDYEDWLNDSD
jgi:hypothetical protein